MMKLVAAALALVLQLLVPECGLAQGNTSVALYQQSAQLDIALGNGRKVAQRVFAMRQGVPESPNSPAAQAARIRPDEAEVVSTVFDHIECYSGQFMSALSVYLAITNEGDRNRIGPQIGKMRDTVADGIVDSLRQLEQNVAPKLSGARLRDAMADGIAEYRRAERIMRSMRF